MSILAKLEEAGLINPRDFVVPNTQFLTIGGSHAYGAAESGSDYDLLGFTIPPMEVLLPDHILGFGTPPRIWTQYQKAPVQYDGHTYDITIFSIVQFLHLAWLGNPSIIDLFFSSSDRWLVATPIAQMVITVRQWFVTRLTVNNYVGFANSQMSALRKPPSGSRVAVVRRYGYDVKHAFHAIRLITQAEQLLRTGTMDLTKDRDMFISIRRGRWLRYEVEKLFEEKLAIVTTLFAENDLPEKPSEAVTRTLLYSCLEEYYGSI